MDAALEEQRAVPIVTEVSLDNPSIVASMDGPADRNPSVVVVTTSKDRRALDRARREERDGRAASLLVVVGEAVGAAALSGCDASEDCGACLERERVSTRWRQGVLCLVRMGRESKSVDAIMGWVVLLLAEVGRQCGALSFASWS